MRVSFCYDTKGGEPECAVEMTGRELVVNFVKHVYRHISPIGFERLVNVLASEEFLSEEEAMKLECFTPDYVWGKGGD